jgi:hypothetical protein
LVQSEVAEFAPAAAERGILDWLETLGLPGNFDFIRYLVFGPPIISALAFRSTRHWRDSLLPLDHRNRASISSETDRAVIAVIS